MLNSKWISTWGGVGFSPIAPGTMASLVSLLLWIPLMKWGSFGLWAAVWFLLFALGFWAIGTYQQKTKKHDASEIVIDEVLGQGLALWACPDHWAFILLAVGLFRLFDILKPWPISWIDRSLKTPSGVLLDDLMAGIFSALVIAFIS